MKTAKINVAYVNHMGSDLTVVNAARVSFSKESELEYAYSPIDESGCQRPVEPPKVLKQSDAKLIQYLADHDHWSPFAHTSIQLRIKAPIFVARQLVKHQVGLVWNEVSRRYVDDAPEFYLPEQWRGKPINAKQGSSSEVIEAIAGVGVAHAAEYACLKALQAYNRMIDGGVAPEMARMVLPLNTMTEWYWTGSLMAFTRVCRQRLDPHAQEETRLVAQGIAAIAEPLFPVSWKALV